MACRCWPSLNGHLNQFSPDWSPRKTVLAKDDLRKIWRKAMKLQQQSHGLNMVKLVIRISVELEHGRTHRSIA